MGKAVLELSGGWQMRLALACAVARKAIITLVEPTPLRTCGKEEMKNRKLSECLYYSTFLTLSN